MRHTTHLKRRQRRSADEIQALLSTYRSSGLTQREFADQNRLSFSTFTYWLRRYRDSESPAARTRRSATSELIRDWLA
jgi:hypothetical protein